MKKRCRDVEPLQRLNCVKLARFEKPRRFGLHFHYFLYFFLAFQSFNSKEIHARSEVGKIKQRRRLFQYQLPNTVKNGDFFDRTIRTFYLDDPLSRIRENDDFTALSAWIIGI